MEHLLGTDSRNPAAKHRILEMYVEHGFEPPDTPVMALHRGRIDLLEEHLARDPDLLTRTFNHEEIYPPAPACAREPYTAQGTPLHGTTLLHIAAYFDELEIASGCSIGAWTDARAAVDADGFGGYTALFSTVVSSADFWMNYGKGQPDVAPFTRCCSTAAPIRTCARRCARTRGGARRRTGARVPRRHAARLGRRFHGPIFVSRAALRLIEAKGGGR